MKRKNLLTSLFACSLIMSGLALVSCGDAPADQQGGEQQGDEQGGGQQGGEQGGGSQTDPVKEFTVTFNYNYTGAPAAQTAKVKEGAKVAKPANPSREGYTFDNWYENATGTGSAFNFDSTINPDKTLYAKRNQNSGGGETPTPTPEPGDPLPDNHQGTLAEDASWKRTDIYARAAAGSDQFASFVTAVEGSGGAFATPSNRADSKGFLPVSNTNKNTGGTITYSLTSSAAAKVGIYVYLSVANAAGKANDIFEINVNGAKIETENFDMPSEGTKRTSSEKYIFAGYANLTTNDNTVQYKIVQTSDLNNGANFYGFRFSAQTATIAGKTAA